MDYLTPLEARRQSFREFVDEWILGQFDAALQRNGLERPWYWDELLHSSDHYHHRVYLSAYTHRATVWFDLKVPSPEERAWLVEKYPSSLLELAPLWDRIDQRWREAGPGVEWHTHGATPIGFCSLCQLVLSGGSARENSAETIELEGRRYIFCSAPCRWIFEREPERYKDHLDLVSRILRGHAPANLLMLVREYFGLDAETRGRDTYGGAYPWLEPHRDGRTD
jgi:toluene monooxygenase system protein A